MVTHRRILSLLATSLVIMLASPPAQGEEILDPAAQLANAEKLATEGRVAEAMAIWETVLPAVGTAQAAKLYARLGLGYRKFGKLPEAWHHLNLHTQSTGSPDPAAVESLAQLNKALPKNWEQVEITTNPPGANVYFGDSAAGTMYETPLMWWFKPGTHALHLVKATFEPLTVTLKVEQPGGTRVASFELTEDQRDGILQVKGPEGGAQVFIDGFLEGTIPFHRKLKSGTYELMVGRPGLPVWKKQVVVAPGGTTVERPRLKAETDKSLLPSVTATEAVERLPEKSITQTQKHSRKAPAWWKWAIAGSGIAMVGIGGALNSAAISRNDELQQQYPDGTYWNRAPAENPRKYQDGYNGEVVPMATTAYILYGVGAAAAVTGTILLFIPEGESGGGATVAPIVAPDTAGISFSLGF